MEKSEGRRVEAKREKVDNEPGLQPPVPIKPSQQWMIREGSSVEPTHVI